MLPRQFGMVGENLLGPTAFDPQLLDPASNPLANVGCHLSRMAVGLSAHVKYASHDMRTMAGNMEVLFRMLIWTISGIVIYGLVFGAFTVGRILGIDSIVTGTALVVF